MSLLLPCDKTLSDGRRCMRIAGRPHKYHQFEGIKGEPCSCMLRIYPNRCTAHPEKNQ